VDEEEVEEVEAVEDGSRLTKEEATMSRPVVRSGLACLDCGSRVCLRSSANEKGREVRR
jgi:hypothetical protein